MKHFIVADAGSTSVKWLSSTGTEYTGIGVNALITDSSMLEAIFRQAAEQLGADAVNAVYYYGAGCVSDEINEPIRRALMKAFGCSIVEVHDDLLGASRALYGHESGIACILGTGSNSGLYDGNSITDHIPPMGYILGDEGSGAALGKMIVSDVFKRQLPESLCESFLTHTALTYPRLVEHVYRRPNANRWLASLVPWIRDHINEVPLESRVIQCFEAFVTRNILPYGCAETVPIGFVGSIAVNFAPQLNAALQRHNLAAAAILPSAAAGLLRYHSDR